MQTIGDLFNILLFVTAAGSIFTILSLFADRVLRIPLPLWSGVCGMALYLLPFPAPGLYLIPPETHSWIPGYSKACTVWVCGMVLLAVYDLAKALLARRAVCGYRLCREERILDIFSRCVRLMGMRKIPSVYFGTLSEPACVTGTLHPVIILNEDVIRQLSDTELLAVLCHEAAHIRRGHLILGRMYDYICILNWFNLLAWIARRAFSVQCETDCDRTALACLGNEITHEGYAGTMLRLLELTMIPACSGSGIIGVGSSIISGIMDSRNRSSMGALGFLIAKRRIALILNRPSRGKRFAMSLIPAMLLAITILFSTHLSRGHFYPYPAYDRGVEYGKAVTGSLSAY